MLYDLISITRRRGPLPKALASAMPAETSLIENAPGPTRKAAVASGTTKMPMERIRRRVGKARPSVWVRRYGRLELGSPLNPHEFGVSGAPAFRNGASEAAGVLDARMPTVDASLSPTVSCVRSPGWSCLHIESFRRMSTVGVGRPAWHDRPVDGEVHVLR